MAQKASRVGPHVLALVTLSRVLRCPSGLSALTADFSPHPHPRSKSHA
jgi:hypothetical protein